MPETTSSSRMAIGCVKLVVKPGTLAERLRHGVDELFLGAPGLPRLDRMELHVHVALVDAHRLGREVRTPELRDHLSHFREAP